MDHRSGIRSLNRLGSSQAGSNILGGLNKTGTGSSNSWRLFDQTGSTLAGTSCWIKNGFSLVTISLSLFWTGSTGTANVFARIITSKHANRCDHLSSSVFRSSEVGLLVFFLLALGDSSGSFFFLSAGVFSKTQPPSTCLTAYSLLNPLGWGRSSRVGSNCFHSVFFVLPCPVGRGVANCWICSAVNALQIGQSFF